MNFTVVIINVSGKDPVEKAALKMLLSHILFSRWDISVFFISLFPRTCTSHCFYDAFYLLVGYAKCHKSVVSIKYGVISVMKGCDYV